MPKFRRNSIVALFLLVLVEAAALARPPHEGLPKTPWPPRDAAYAFGNPCAEIIFFTAVTAELAARNVELDIARLEAEGNHVEAANLRLLNAKGRAAVANADIFFEGQIATFLEAMNGGMSPFQLFQMLGRQPFTPGWELGQNLKGEPYFNKQAYPLLEAEFELSYATPFYHSQNGFVSENSPLMVPTIAGVGAKHSHSGSVFALLNLLLSDSGKKSGIVAALKADPNYVRVNPFAFDLPNNGGAFRSALFNDLNMNMHWLRGALGHFGRDWKKKKELESVEPLVLPIARSASPSLLLQMHQMFPDFMKGLIAVSPLHPLDLENGNKTLKKLVEQGVYDSNEQANEWVDSLYEQMTWHQKEDPFLNDLPVLILVGTKDPEETDALEPKLGWDIYREWERKYPHKVRFIIVEGAGHDLFAIRDKEILQKVMKYVYRFFQFVLKGEKDMAAAFPIEEGEIRLPWKEIFWKGKDAAR